MVFLELIEILKTKEATLKLAEKEAAFAEEYDTILILLKNEISIQAEIKFVDGEEEIRTNFVGRSIGGKYYELFALSHLQEMVEDYVKAYPEMSNKNIAERIIQYRIKDA